jgi:hypothetical protein
MLKKERSHIKFNVQLKAFVCVFIFCKISLLCFFHLSFKSSQSSRILTFSVKFLIMSLSLTAVFMLNFFHAQIKCISSYFCKTKKTSCFKTQSRQISCAFFKTLQILFIIKSNTSRLTSLTKLMQTILFLMLLQHSMSFKL